MTQVQPGDVIFSYVDQNIAAISVAKTGAIQSQRPKEFSDQELWKQNGFRIEVEYRDVKPLLHVPPIVPRLQPLLPSKYSPLTVNGTGVQGYLFTIPAPAGRLLLDLIGAEIGANTVDAEIESGIRSSNLDNTTKKALVDCRIGQGRFRDDLLKYWVGRCAVTGVSLIPMLRASHIKPWRDSNNLERLDTFNGLMLSPNYDAAFDRGLISFDDQGLIILSKKMPVADAKILGLALDVRLSRIDVKHLPYLEHHRTSVFDF
jgi:hypothetical protein